VLLTRVWKENHWWDPTFVALERLTFGSKVGWYSVFLIFGSQEFISGQMYLFLLLFWPEIKIPGTKDILFLYNSHLGPNLLSFNICWGPK